MRARLSFLGLCWRAWDGDAVAAFKVYKMLLTRAGTLIRKVKGL